MVYRTRNRVPTKTSSSSFTNRKLAILVAAFVTSYTLHHYRQATRVPIVACMVLRSTSIGDTIRSENIMNGWGRMCNYLQFIDRNTSGLAGDWLDGYGNLAGKSLRGWQFMHQKYGGTSKESDRNGLRADFYLKADTDSYIVASNLLEYLALFDPSVPHYIGRQFLHHSGVSFVAGTAIILSAAALSELEDASKLRKDSMCSFTHFSENFAEDLALALCLRELGIFPQNTRDEHGSERFMVFSPSEMYDTAKPFQDWYYNFSFNTKKGPGCCSSRAVAFHQVSVDELRLNDLVFRQNSWLSQSSLLSIDG